MTIDKHALVVMVWILCIVHVPIYLVKCIVCLYYLSLRGRILGTFQNTVMARCQGVHFVPLVLSTTLFIKRRK